MTLSDVVVETIIAHLKIRWQNMIYGNISLILLKSTLKMLVVISVIIHFKNPYTSQKRGKTALLSTNPQPAPARTQS